MTTTLFVPLVGFTRYQVCTPLIDKALLIETPAYVMLDTGYPIMWTTRSVEVALTVFENVTELAAVHCVLLTDPLVLVSTEADVKDAPDELVIVEVETISPSIDEVK